MAAPQNPLAAIMAQRLVGQMAAQGGGAPGGGPPSPAGQPSSPPADPNAAGRQVAQQLAELQGADPQSMTKLLQQVKSICVNLYSRAAFTVPGMARNIAKAQQYLDSAIKEGEQAAATASTVATPIANSVGQSGPSGPGLQQFSDGA